MQLELNEQSPWTLMPGALCWGSAIAKNRRQYETMLWNLPKEITVLCLLAISVDNSQ